MVVDGVTYHYHQQLDREGRPWVSYFEWEVEDLSILVHPQEPITPETIRKYNRLRKMEFNVGQLAVGLAITGLAAVVALATALATLLGAESAAATTRLIPPLRSAAPSGLVVKVEVTDSPGVLGGTYYLDPHQEVGVCTVPGGGGKARPYAAIIVNDGAGRSELDCTTNEIYCTGGDSYAHLEAKLDALGNQMVEVVEEAEIDGVRTLVVRGRVPSSDSESQVGIRNTSTRRRNS